ncbi:MAG: FG-GAP repeat domain-containing protein, partial [bacterium]
MKLRPIELMLAMFVFMSFENSHGQRLLEGRFDYVSLSRPVALCAADFNGDGYADIAVASAHRGAMQILHNAGNAVFSPGQTLTVGKNPQDVAAADLDNDGRPDLVVAVTGNNHLKVFFNNGQGQLEKSLDLLSGNWPVDLLLEDVNRDGLTDIIVANSLNDGVTIFYNKGQRRFSIMNNFRTG